MIIAAGLGTRMRPLTELRPKPALPVRGLPLIAYPLALLAAHDVDEVVINVHHLPELLVDAARAHRPPGMAIEFSHEPELLGTGGALRPVADFLRGSDPCLVVAGDMLFEADLTALVARHRERGAGVTLVLRDDARTAAFGSIGVDEDGRVRRIAGGLDLGGETAAGLYTCATVFSAAVLDTLPEREVFSHLSDWIAPRVEAGARDVVGEILSPGDCTWEPVGTPGEYLAANLSPPHLSFLDADALARVGGARIETDLVVGAGAVLGDGAHLKRAVVWDGERVPAGFNGRDGVYAGGAFYSCAITEEPGPGARGGLE
jgi:NDP-sugar pyrophosphorylase family protein